MRPVRRSATIRRMLNVTFPEVASALQQANVDVSAAEAHGWLCGALCTTEPLTLPAWFDELLPSELDEAARESATGDGSVLHILYEETIDALQGMEMQFMPLVPADDALLLRRSESLGQWCLGFLYGLGTHLSAKRPTFSAEVEEALRDLTEIGRVAADDEQDSEEQEQAYSELVEFVRISVQLIHDELSNRLPIATGEGLH